MGDFTHDSAGCNHQALTVGQKEVAIDARQVVEALDVGDGTEFSQVMVSQFVLGQQRNLEAVVFLAAVQVVAA